MDETAKWAISLLLQAGVFVALWRLIGQVSEFRKDLENVKGDMQNLRKEIGVDSNSGLRGRTHKHRGQIGMLAHHVDNLREKAGLRAIDLAEEFRKDKE